MAILKYKDPDTGEWKVVDVVSDGVTFIPQINDDGTLSWSNNGHLDNPEPVKLDSKEIVIKDNKAQFPSQGDPTLIYIASQENAIYRWDPTSLTYISIGGGGGGTGKLEHSLTIGDKVFDGTKDVVVEIYSGDMG